MILASNCSKCGDTFDTEVPTDGYLRWRSGALITNALPELTADQREMLITGFCSSCFGAVFTRSENVA